MLMTIALSKQSFVIEVALTQPYDDLVDDTQLDSISHWSSTLIEGLPDAKIKCPVLTTLLISSRTDESKTTVRTVDISGDDGSCHIHELIRFKDFSMQRAITEQ